ncbi:MAG: outer membrane protein assembly factor BamE [Acetobacter sp.]|nr:outer membrane protein assembly factor BamE [Acetobacter sp.]
MPGLATIVTSLRPRQRQKLAALCLLSGMGLLTSGCSLFSPTPMDRGSLIEPADYKQLQPGTSNRADVLDLLGSPTTKATFDDNTWIYISMVTVPTPVSFPDVIKQQVIVLNFDPAGTLQSMRELRLKDGKNVTMSSDTTPTPGTKINIMQEILGNVGRYNPMSGMMNQNGGSFGGATGPMGSNNGPGHGGTGNTLP